MVEACHVNGWAADLLSSVLSGLARTGAPYALVDYPLYNNPGDAAIWVGARHLLLHLFQRAPSYTSTLRDFNGEACRRAIGPGTIFVLGGGNFGSLYPRHHAGRLALFGRMRDNPIVQLPFSFAGTETRVMDQTAQAIEDHGSIRLIARERLSQDLGRRHLGLDLTTAPDTAHVMPLAARSPIRAETRLFRRDRETASVPAAGPSWDWADVGQLRLVNRLGKVAYRTTLGQTRRNVMDRLAALRVEVACDRLGEGAHVQTNRLHGLILAGMMGRQVTAYDNATGKLGSYLETWGEVVGRVTLRHADGRAVGTRGMAA